MDLLSSYNDEASNNGQVTTGGVLQASTEAEDLQSEWENFEKSVEYSRLPAHSESSQPDDTNKQPGQTNVSKLNQIKSSLVTESDDESHLPPGVRKKNRCYSSSSSSEDEAAKDKAGSDSDSSSSGDSDASSNHSGAGGKKTEIKDPKPPILKKEIPEAHSKKSQRSKSSSRSRSRSASPPRKRRPSRDRRSRSRSQGRRSTKEGRHDSRRQRSKERKRSKERESGKLRETKSRRSRSREKHSERALRGSFDRSKRSRSKERSKRSRSKDRSKRSRSKDRSKRSRSRDRKKRSHSRESENREKIKRSESKERVRSQSESKERVRSQSVEHLKSPSLENNKRDQSEEKVEKSPVMDRDKRSPSKESVKRSPSKEKDVGVEGKERSKRSRSRERSKRSKSKERVKRSRSRDRSRRSRSRERSKRNKERSKRSRSRERSKRSRSKDRSKRSRSKDRSKESKERSKRSRSKERSKRSRSKERSKRSRSKERNKRSRSKERRSRSLSKGRSKREWRRNDRSASPCEAKVIKYGDRVIKAGASFGRPPPSKPMTFKEKMRQQLIKTIEEGGDVSQAFTDKDGTVICTRTAGTLQIPAPKTAPVPLMASLVPAPPGLPAATITASEAAIQSMLALQKETTEKTGVEIPKYYNPAAINPVKYAEQVQKRKLLWSKTKDKDVNTQWNTTSLSSDHDDKSKEKFRKLMGIKQETGGSAGGDGMGVDDQDLKQKELFEKLDKEYQFARMATHTHRGVGLGFGSSGYQPPTV